MTTPPGPSPLGDALRVLLPYDGSESARRAVDRLVTLTARGMRVELHLVNVRPPLRSDVTRFVPPANVQDYHREEGLNELAGAIARLDEAGLGHQEHVAVGEPVERIAALATEIGAELVVMGTRGRGGVAALLLGSVATGVVRSLRIPVMLVH